MSDDKKKHEQEGAEAPSEPATPTDEVSDAQLDDATGGSGQITDGMSKTLDL